MTPKQERAATERALDPELRAVKLITRMLNDLAQPARARVLRYVNDRMAEPKQADLPIGGPGAGA